MCAKTTKGNGDGESEDEECPQHASCAPKMTVVSRGTLYRFKLDKYFGTASFSRGENRRITTVHEPIQAGTVSFAVQKDFKDYKSPPKAS